MDRWKQVTATLTLLLVMAVISLAVHVLYEKPIAVGATADPDGIMVPVIMYHHIHSSSSRVGTYTIYPEEFEADIKCLRDNGFTAVSVAELIAFVESGEPLPEKPIILSFDDGRLSFLHYAVPLLEKYDQKASVAIVGEYADDATEEQDSNVSYAYLTWEDIRTLGENPRAEVLNHSDRLHICTKERTGAAIRRGESEEEYRAVLAADVGGLQQRLYEHTGTWPCAFVYPFGQMCAQSPDVLDEIGFSAAFTCISGVDRFREGDTELLMNIKRINRIHGKTLESILRDYDLI